MSTASRSRRSPRLTVEVTQEIIDTATRRDSSHCMIADAIQRAVPEAKYISVDLATIRLTDQNAGLRYIYLTPRPAQEALLAFDQGEKPRPFKVRLEAAQVLLSGNAKKAKAGLTPAGGNRIPVRVDGKSPPIGPLVGGSSGGPGAPGASRTGRVRAFGLRAIIR